MQHALGGLFKNAVVELPRLAHVEYDKPEEAKMSFTTMNGWANKVTERQAIMRKSRNSAPQQQVGETRLEPARGILAALALSAPIWVLIAAVVYAVT